jgi:carboxypeptidase C (cathepsin A)
MNLDPALRGNVQFAFYPSGHMIYLNTDALQQLKADLSRFYDQAAPRR